MIASINIGTQQSQNIKKKLSNFANQVLISIHVE